MMAENDINNEEQYKEAAKKLIKYYNENKEELKKVYNKKTKKYTFDEICNKEIVDKIYSDFRDSFSLSKLSLFNNQDILTRFLFQNGNKNDFFHQLEFNTKELGSIRGGSVYKYRIHKDESGWISGSSEKNSKLVNEQEALTKGKELLKNLIDGGKLIENYKNELISIEKYDLLENDLKKINEFSKYIWVRKYYHMLFPNYLCNWFSEDKLTKILEKLGITPLKTYYGKSRQLSYIYEKTGYNNPVLCGYLCGSISNFDKDEDDEKEDSEERNESSGEKNMESFPLNQILYGPPGTGKTYNTVIEAMRIINPQLITEYENKRKNYDEIKEEFNKQKRDGCIEFITFHQSYAYEEFVEGIKPNLENWDESSEKLTYKGEDGIFKIIAKEAYKKDNKDKKYVLIIDEINRGNISKIFGELITLIEEDKRESFSVRLPYSHEEFTVPKNLYIIGTMNTSDRSIASIDIALRRRFTFKEMMPDKNRVTEEIKENNTTIKLQNIFNTLNKRISVLLDRDHQIGHSYFMNVKCIDDLKKVWFNSIMPLLNEYFYNDWEKLRALLGEAKDPVENKDNNDNNDKNKKIWPSFIKKTEETTFAIEYEIDKDEQFDFVSDTEIDFEKALENVFTKKTS